MPSTGDIVHAIQSGDTTEIRKLITERDANGLTYLHIAAIRNNSTELSSILPYLGK